MKKVLILANSLEGLYNFRKELLERLIEENYEVTLSAPFFKEKLEYFKDLDCDYIETPIDLRGVNPFRDAKLLLKYYNILKQVKPDIVLTYTIKPNIYGGIISRLQKVPYITNITGLGTAVETESILQKIVLFLYKISQKDAKQVFFQNKENQDFMLKRNIVKTSRLIPGSGVDLERFPVLNYPVDFGNDPTRFLFIGRVMKEKGIEQYLEAAKAIKKKHSNTEFHVVGNCEEEYLELLKELEQKDIIKYHGSQDDIRKFHQISHCTIHPSYYPEGMSNVLLESAASGRPIITTDRAGCREIADDEVNGYVVEQKNSTYLIEKIENFLMLTYEKRKEMGLKGREKVEKEFDRNIIIKEYLKEINRIGCEGR
jgi:glycosyltransferase involved in cell wall biosynthesis